MKTPLLVLIFMIPGCQSQQQALGPDGPSRTVKTWKTPTDVPTIDLTVDNQFTKWTLAPTIIDTHTFANQRQLGDSVDGPYYRPANFLPAHKKPQVQEEGPPNDLRAGQGNTPTLIHDVNGFETITQTPWTPPDPSLAVGPNHVLITVNMAIAWYTKDGNEQFSARLDSTGSPGFFEEIGAGDFTFDPKCFYDIHSQRFVVLALEKYDNEAWITMAVSDDDDPNGVWYKYRTWSVIDINGSGYWVDYPGFGFDNDYFYVTGNLYGLDSGWGGVLYRIFDKTPILSGEPVEITDIRKGAHVSMQGTQQYGDSTTAFFVGRRNSTQLRIASILTPSSPSVTSSIVNVPSNSGPGGVSNPGGSLNTLDGRMMNAQLRDDSLFASHGIAGSGVTAQSRWYEFDVTNFPNNGPTLIQSGNVEMSNSLSSFYPAIAPNKRGEVAVVMGAANSTTIPELYIAGRKQGDELGQMGEPLLVATGTHGTDGRWGDYFDMTVDPNNEIMFWYSGQYKTENGWQTYVGSALISCVEDVNVDGFVNVNDLLLLIGNWGGGGEGAEIASPYDTVGVNDILALIAKFGICP